MQILQVKTSTDFNESQVPAESLLVWAEVIDGKATFHCKDENGNIQTIGGTSGGGGLPVTTLGTSGAQTINRAVSDVFILPAPTGAVTLPFSHFTVGKSAILIIENGGINISWPDLIKWDNTDSFDLPTLQSYGYDIIEIHYVTTGKYICEHLGTYDATLTTSYSNTGGQGDRSAIINVTTNLTLADNAAWSQDINSWINGNTSSNGTLFYESSATGKFIEFEFYTPVFIDEVTLVVSAGNSYQGTYKWQARNDVGDDWLDVSSVKALDSTPFPLVYTSGLYKYYRLLGMSGNPTSDCLAYELEFKIAQ